jgi:large subunit ribosomal protein L29
MKAHEMRSLAQEELATRVTTWEEEYFKARCNRTVGQLQDTSQLRKLRRDIARGRTILSEKVRNAASEE